MDGQAAFLATIPSFSANTSPFGVGVTIGVSGQNLAAGMNSVSSYFKTEAMVHSFDANRAIKIGSYDRREQEWALQSNLAAGDITQINKQILAAQIKASIAERELENHEMQMKYAEEVEQFLSGEETSVGDAKHTKTSNQGFYAWMKREVKGLYGQVFQFAFDIAKKAERALQHELGDPALSFLQFGYLSGKEGLLAGEKLYLDIKRMEIAYHDQNRREYELTKHVSLLQVDPLALMQLRATGSCTVALPEALFDMDCPGHYFRRIKSVALSIPCVTGPYSGVNCTLTLLKSSIRRNALLSEFAYAREGNDDRFSDHFDSLQSIVTSSTRNDSGLFETNLHDERYLPFENSGVISEWRLQLPANPSVEPSEPLQFDYDTISDVILHIRYTAREGGELLRKGAVKNIATLIDNAEAAGSVRLLSLRHEFSTEWARFKSTQIDVDTGFAPLTVNLHDEHYPFWSRGRLDAIKWLEVYVKTSEELDIAHNAAGDDSYRIDGALGDLRTGRLSEPPDSPTGEYTLYLSTNDVEDLWLLLAWGAEDGD